MDKFKCFLRLPRLIITIFLSLSIFSCGGESTMMSAGISGTGIVLGVITGFGSIFVNGVEYDLKDADLVINDDVNPVDKALQVGMVVRLQATDNGDGTGVATKVVYDELISGPVSSAPVSPFNGNSSKKSFQILGKTIIVDNVTTSFAGGVGFGTLKANDVLEVSGFIDDKNQISATRVELKGALDQGLKTVEIHGQVSNLDVVTPQSFDLDGISVDYSSASYTDLNSGLSNGQFVEVTGVFISATSIQADSIEGEDDDKSVINSASGRISLQGYITSFTDKSHFMVDGTSVELNTDSIPTSVLNVLALGVEVEVVGQINSGILTADSIKLREGNFEFAAQLKSVNTSSTSLGIGFPDISGEITLKIDNSSLMISGSDGTSLTLSDLNSKLQHDVKIKARFSDNTLYVSSLKLFEDPLHTYEVECTFSAKDPGNNVTVFGVSLPLEGKARSADLSAFIEDVTIVELEDKDKNGFFESIELED